MTSRITTKDAAFRGLSQLAASASAAMQQDTSKHAELMESRRRSKVPEAGRVSARQTRPSHVSEASLTHAGSTNDMIALTMAEQKAFASQMELDIQSMLNHMSMLHTKVDIMADQVSKCLHDTSHIRSIYDSTEKTCLGPRLPEIQPSGQLLIEPAAARFTTHLSTYSSGNLGGHVHQRCAVEQTQQEKSELSSSGGNGTKATPSPRHELDVDSSGEETNAAEPEANSPSDDQDPPADPNEMDNVFSAHSFYGMEKPPETPPPVMPAPDPAARRPSVLPPPPTAVTFEKRVSSNRRPSSGKLGLSLDYLDHVNTELQQELHKVLRRVRPRSQWSKDVWSFLEDPDSVWGGRTCMNFISALILVSAAVPVIQTIEPPPMDSAISEAELGLDGIFAAEVVIRFITCPNRIAFCLDPYNFVDIAAGVLVLVLRSVSTASFVSADETGNSIILSLMCAVPVLRLLKLLRRFDDFHLILRAFRLASEALPVLLFILSIIVLMFASLIYILEPRSNIESLPKALWLTMVTVGTVGYGDVVPTSAAGSLVTAAMIVVSALYMSIPMGIVGKAFSTVWEDRDRLLMIHRARNRFLERGYKPQDIPAMFCSFDKNGDGELDLPEFMAMMHKMQVALGTDRMVELFLSFDADGSGAIDDSEFVRNLFPSAYAQIYGLGRMMEQVHTRNSTAGDKATDK